METEYKIVKLGKDFYIAHQDFQRDCWRTDVKLGSETFDGQKNLVEREGFFMEPYQEIGNVKFRFGTDIDYNYMSIDGADDIKLTWPQAAHMMSNLREKQNRDSRKALDEARLQRMEKAATAGEVTEPGGD